MDEVTQQNSALVEENAATAKTLEGQSQALDGRVAAFRLIEGDLQPNTVPAPKAKTRKSQARSGKFPQNAVCAGSGSGRRLGGVLVWPGCGPEGRRPATGRPHLLIPYQY